MSIPQSVLLKDIRLWDKVSWLSIPFLLLLLLLHQLLSFKLWSIILVIIGLFLVLFQNVFIAL